MIKDLGPVVQNIVSFLNNWALFFMPPHRMMPGAYSFSVFRTCIRMYVRLYIHTYVRTYVRDTVRLRLRHLYQVEPEHLGAHIFQTIRYIWFIFGLMIDIGPKLHSTIPHTHAYDLKVKVMDLEIFNVKVSG